MKNYLLISLIAILMFSCSSLKITVNMDSSLPFDGYKTYSYMGWDSASTHINKYYQREIEYSFAEEFGLRGMSYDSSGNGDIMISLFFVVDVEKQTTAYSTYYSPYGYHQPGWGWGYGYRPGYPYSYGGVVYEENNYYYGTLVCDVFDNTSKQLAWQGVASKALSPSSKNKAENIRLAISRLMREFPKQKLESDAK